MLYCTVYISFTTFVRWGTEKRKRGVARWGRLNLEISKKGCDGRLPSWDRTGIVVVKVIVSAIVIRVLFVLLHILTRYPSAK